MTAHPGRDPRNEAFMDRTGARLPSFAALAIAAVSLLLAGFACAQVTGLYY